MEKTGGFFFLLGMIVTVIAQWKKDNLTTDEALTDFYKDLIFASEQGIKRIEHNED